MFNNLINTNTLIWTLIAWLMIVFFAGIEIAFANANRLTIEIKKKQGLKRSILLSRFMENPSRFISAMLIGFNLFLVIFGMLVGETLSPFWEKLILKTAIPQAWVDIARLLVETLTSALFILFFGELVPKALFRAKSDSLLDFFAPFCKTFYDLFHPISAFFTRISEWILKYVFNVRIDERKDLFAKADLSNFFQQTGEADESRQELNTELFEAALSLPKVKVRECLIPRKEIDGVDIRLSVDDARKKFMSTKLSKLVVYEGNIDHVLGYVHQLDLFKGPRTVRDILLPIPAVPESMSATDLISKFSRERKSIAWVVDEFGGTAGIVTMEDVLEQVVGRIEDEYPHEATVSLREAVAAGGVVLALAGSL